MNDLGYTRARLLAGEDNAFEKCHRAAAMRLACDLLRDMEGDLDRLRDLAGMAAKEHYVNAQTSRIKHEIDDMRRAFSNALRLAETGEL